MCPESQVHFAEGPEAEVGDQLTIKQFRRGQDRFTMYARISAPKCPICLPDGSSVVFTNLTAAIQQRTETGAEATAVLQNGWAYESEFLFANGAVVRMSELRRAMLQVIQPMDVIDVEGNEVIEAAGRTIDRPEEVSEEVLIGAASNRGSMSRAIAGAAGAFFLALIAH